MRPGWGELFPQTGEKEVRRESATPFFRKYAGPKNDARHQIPKDLSQHPKNADLSDVENLSYHVFRIPGNLLFAAAQKPAVSDGPGPFLHHTGQDLFAKDFSGHLW